MKGRWLIVIVTVLTGSACSKKGSDTPVTPTGPFSIGSISLSGSSWSADRVKGVGVMPSIQITVNAPVKRSTAATAIQLIESQSAVQVALNLTYSNGDSVIIVQPAASLKYLTQYDLQIDGTLGSSAGKSLGTGTSRSMNTKIDSTRKFTVISDDSLLTLIQQKTFRYFWDFAHPVSGLARERNSSGETVTSGGSGFGIMAILAGINRNFISRAQGLSRLQTITTFLKTKAQTFHGAFPHWLNGSSGAVIPFSSKDNGADLVETSYLMQGLLCARQYFNTADAGETALRNDINALWTAVEWDWFRQNNQDVLYWHWSSDQAWAMNVPIKGWNESLITYVLAASSTTHAIPKSVYDKGWASDGAMANGSTFYGYTLPLGPAMGGPLFFEHYSFLGINPNGLKDAWADYGIQTKNHTLINYTYCQTNPKGYYGYSDSCWGLTASDIPNGYTAASPTNDVGVIAPTAAISSLPYTTAESMKAIRNFYYVLGDKIWGDYGFYDSFSTDALWFGNSYLAIDQGPEIVMIENYRSGLLWNLLASCPEVKTGMHSLGFTAPWL